MNDKEKYERQAHIVAIGLVITVILFLLYSLIVYFTK